MRKWINTELERGKEELIFRTFLVEQGIKYETSDAYGMVHFECFMNDDEAQEASEVLEMISCLDAAKDKAGFRELYAMEYGSPIIVKESGRLFVRFMYPESFSFQDGNGATYDIERKTWVG